MDELLLVRQNIARWRKSIRSSRRRRTFFSRSLSLGSALISRSVVEKGWRSYEDPCLALVFQKHHEDSRQSGISSSCTMPVLPAAVPAAAVPAAPSTAPGSVRRSAKSRPPQGPEPQIVLDALSIPSQDSDIRLACQQHLADIWKDHVLRSASSPSRPVSKGRCCADFHSCFFFGCECRQCACKCECKRKYMRRHCKEEHISEAQ